MKKSVLILLVLLSINSTVFAQLTGGGYAESYLLRNIGARAISMAGAYTAIVNEPTALFYNPAGLSSLASRAMFTTSLSLMQYGRSQDYLAWGQTFGKIGVGLALNNYNSSSVISRDVRGNPLGTFSDVQFNFNGGISYAMEMASIGIGFKYLSNSINIGGTSANGFAMDLGMKYDVAGLFTFGLSMQNVLSTMKWNTPSEESSKVPYTIRAGIAMEFPFNETTYTTRTTALAEKDTVNEPSTRYILFGLDAIYSQFQEHPNIVLGIELSPHEVVAFRAGITLMGDDMGKFKILPFNTWGTGISVRPIIQGLPFGFHLDYSIGAEYLSPDRVSHHFSVFLQF